MLHLLETEEGRARLEAAAGGRLLCAFDFDGTLAPIVARPEDAALPPSTRERLQALQRYVPVAIITGRAIADIAPRLGFAPDILIGNHGMEGVPGERASEAARMHRGICAAWREQLERALAAEYPDPGVQVEDKAFSLSVHYRHAQAADHAQRDLEPLLAALDPPPRLVGGKCVFNLMPPGAADKGRALLQTMEETGAAAALYAGDDVTDEDVFRLQHPDLLGLRIGASGHSAARWFLPDIGCMPLLLDTLRDLLARNDARNWLGNRAE